MALMTGTYVVALVEEWTASGHLRPAAPFQAAAAMLVQEPLVPRQPDRLLFEVAPLLLLAAAVLAAGVLPLAPGTVMVDMATGVLFVNAALAYVMVALVMAGWGPHAGYALVAGWRFLGQLIAYSMLIVMSIAAVAMQAQSLSMTDVVSSQDPIWNIVTQPLGFALFWLAAMAVSFVPPFDLPIASELAGGVFGEYTGPRLAVLRYARLVLVLTLAAAINVFYLGGYLGPLLPACLWMAIKTFAVATAMLAGGKLVPRMPLDLLLEWGWKLGIPLALANILIVGFRLLVARAL